MISSSTIKQRAERMGFNQWADKQKMQSLRVGAAPDNYYLKPDKRTRRTWLCNRWYFCLLLIRRKHSMRLAGTTPRWTNKLWLVRLQEVSGLRRRLMRIAYRVALWAVTKAKSSYHTHKGFLCGVIGASFLQKSQTWCCCENGDSRFSPRSSFCSDSVMNCGGQIKSEGKPWLTCKKRVSALCENSHSMNQEVRKKNTVCLLCACTRITLTTLL